MKNIASLTDDELRAQVLAFGINAGPVLASTRRVYQIKLEKLLNEIESESSITTTIPTKPKIEDQKPKTKVIKKVSPVEVLEDVEDEEDEEDVEDVEDAEVYEDHYDDQLDASVENEIPEPIPSPEVKYYTSKSNISRSLPDYKRPPLNTSWRDMDTSREFESSESILKQRRDLRGAGDRFDAKSVTQSNQGEAKDKNKIEKRSKFSICLQIIVFLIFCAIAFLIFSNMEPESENPFQKGITNQ